MTGNPFRADEGCINIIVTIAKGFKPWNEAQSCCFILSDWACW